MPNLNTQSTNSCQMGAFSHQQSAVSLPVSPLE